MISDGRILFLDMDGVLNNIRSMIAGSRGVHPPGLLGQVFTVDPHCVRRLRRVVEDLDLLIVLSTTWRRNPSYVKTALRWADNWVAPIVGSTPHRDDGHRGREIEDWCRDHMVQTKKIVIVDDDSFDIHQKDRFVHCVSRNWAGRKKTRLTRRQRTADREYPSELRRQVGFTDVHARQIRELFS